MHLGDVPGPEYPQIWETLSLSGVSSGIWGVMNGARRNAEHCQFFVADPWTYDVAPHPQSLTGLTQMAVYLAKNYLNLSLIKVLGCAVRYAMALFKNMSFMNIVGALSILIEGFARFGPTNATLGAFYEYTATCCFLQNKKRSNPAFSILFLNLLAHTQHHYWKSDKLSPQLAYAFKVVDAAVGNILHSIQPNELLLVANGFCQVNTNHEKPWILYRQKDPVAFVASIGLCCTRVEALMTHDCYLFFEEPAQSQAAFEVLSEAKVNGKPLFWIERHAKEPRKLFYRLDFTDETGPDSYFEVGGKRYPFFEYFEQVVTRTGKHSQEGFVYQSRRLMGDRVENHEIFHHICKHFDGKVHSGRPLSASVR